MYADDNQLFISFVTSEFSAKMSHIEATVDLVSQWMSKTEFLLNGPPLIPVLCHLTPSLHQLDLHTIWVLSLILRSRCPITFALFQNLLSFPSVTSAEFGTLFSTTLHTLSPYLIHSKLDYCNTLFLNILQSQLIVFSSFSTLLLEKSLNLPNSSTSLLFYWLKI